MVHKETVAQRESARCFLFDLQNLACFQFFNAYFVSLLQNRKNMRSPVCACTYSANAPYLFRTNIDDSFLRMSSSSCIFVHFATCVKVITTRKVLLSTAAFTLTHLCLSKNDIKSFANSSAR